MTKRAAATPPIALAVETVRQLGMKPGDVIVSEVWDLPFRLTLVDESAAVIFVDRLVPNGEGTWRASVNIMLKYLPRDVRIKEAPSADDGDETRTRPQYAPSADGGDNGSAAALSPLADDGDKLDKDAPQADDGDKRGNEEQQSPLTAGVDKRTIDAPEVDAGDCRVMSPKAPPADDGDKRDQTAPSSEDGDEALRWVTDDDRRNEKWRVAMSHESGECRIVMLDPVSGRQLGPDHVVMRAATFVFWQATDEERAAWHRFCCLNSRDDADIMVAEEMSVRIRDKAEAMMKEEGHDTTQG